MKLLGFILLLLSSPVHSEDKPWDILIFAQHWSSSVCDKFMEQRPGNSCFPYNRSTWTVHGIWPTKHGSMGPSDCDPFTPLNMQELQSLERELDAGWTPIQRNRRKTYFWEHEWSKHGTCAGPVLPNQRSYFEQALAWIREYNMTGVLSRAGVTHGGSYDLRDIENAIKATLKVNPQIVCYINRNNESVLLEVRICFDKSLRLVDCSQYNNCRYGRILYP